MLTTLMFILFCNLILSTRSAVSVEQYLDWRSLPNGQLMLEDAYLDQPQCTILGIRWICCIARNSAPEGHPDEHAEVLFSDNQGLDWTTGIRLESLGTPTNSYGNILQTEYGRIIVVYNMNLNNVSSFPNGTRFTRDDELGFMVYRFSDDQGTTWSADRFIIPLRNTSIDRSNSFNGSTQIFWSVDQIKKTRNGASLMAYTKIGSYMQNPPEESWFVSSPNVLTEKDPANITWNLLPDGDQGIRPPGTPSNMNWEEAHIIQLENSPGMFTICRTSHGFIGAAHTADDTGSSGWSESTYATFSSLGLPSASGRALKNPEGPITLKRFLNGKYLLLFYFNSVRGYYNATTKRSPRNPYWISSGWEENDGEVHFSQPEIVLYNPGEALKYGSGVGPGYPDFIEDRGSIWITETNKTQARSHLLPSHFLSTLFAADAINGTSTLSLSLMFTPASQNQTFSTPRLPSFIPSNINSATVAFWLENHNDSISKSAIIDVQALKLYVDSDKSLLIELYDSSTRTNVSLSTDEDCTSRLLDNGSHFAAVVIDAPARIITWSVDGSVCDGGRNQFWGFEWAPDSMGDLEMNPHSSSFILGEHYKGTILGGGYYERALMHTELVGTWRAGANAWMLNH